MNKRKNKIFFFKKGLQFGEVNTSYYINNKYEEIQLNDLLKTKKLYWCFYTQKLSIYLQGNNEYIEHLNNIPIKIINQAFYPKPNLFNKHYLYKLLKMEEPDIYKKYLLKMEHITKDLDLNKFVEDNKIVIIKPEPGYGGHGIRIFKSADKIHEYIKNKKFTNEEKRFFNVKSPRKWLVQEYMNNPLLLNKRKFHLRVMVLFILKNNKFKVFIYKKFIPILAKKEYKTNSYNNKNIHNTHAKSLTKELLIEGIEMYDKLKNRELIDNQIIHICKKTSPYVIFKTYPKNKVAFRYVGYDFMVTENYDVKLIELNQNPGFNSFSTHIHKSFWKGMVNLTLYEKKNAVDYLSLNDSENKEKIREYNRRYYQKKKLERQKREKKTRKRKSK